MSEDPIRQMQLRVRDNPLGPVLKRFIRYLIGRGYAASTWQAYVRIAEHFGRWLGRRSLSWRTVQQFLHQHLSACRCPGRVIRNVERNRRALNHLLAMCGLSEPYAATPRGFADDLLRRYADRLARVQGLAAGTVRLYLKVARKMFVCLRIKQPGQLTNLTPERIADYVSSEAQHYQSSMAQNIATVVRSLLRFLFQPRCNRNACLLYVSR